ncbi:MAG TPA: TAT-variant-translocated molybdopterin oxidoreductase [Rhodanobacteraceae bacterium]|nr:TAT-variant-translocated molybdopterin oxidoreductase [Rhodanobacteraceae bacterium]
MSSLTRDTPARAQALQAKLGNARGPRFWRALEELADSEAFRRDLRGAFPRLADAAAMDRRGFLKFLGVSLALAGLAGCSAPPQGEMVPWVRQPERMDGDLPQFYASALPTAGYAVGVLVESHMGRPTKIEGNPKHPASLGATDARLQAAVWQVWDPDRSQAPLRDGDVASWDDFAEHALALDKRHRRDGSGLRILSGRVLSPTLAAQREALLQRYPSARWIRYEPIGDANTLAGARLAFGRPLLPRHHFERAEVIVALDADFLASFPGHVRYARDFATARAPDNGRMGRLYALEPTPSLTGAMADHRWPADMRGVDRFARLLAAELGVAVARDVPADAALQVRVRAAAADLRAHRGKGLVVAGETQPPHVHALAHLLNRTLGNAGSCVEYIEPPAPLEPPAELAALVASMRAGRVQTLLVLGANPVYDAPSDLRFADALARVGDSIHHGLYRDETARACRWHLPQSHALEAWSDSLDSDGRASIVQPLLRPLYDSRSAHELLAMLTGGESDGRALVRATWQARMGDGFEARWRTSLQEGLLPAPPAAPVRVRAASAFVAELPPLPKPAGEAPLELLFRPDPSLWDGRDANNGWLQELPRPLTQLTWRNAALVAPALAERMQLANGDVVELRLHGQRVRAPIWIMPGQAPRSVTVHLGFGRRAAGRVGDGVGFDAYPLRQSRMFWAAHGLQLKATGEHVELAATQHHFTTEASDPIHVLTLEELVAKASAPAEPGAAQQSLYPPREPGDYSWGMAIDLNACIGCKACTIACQAENNIPVVGADEVRRGREMHWIRVDRYYEGDPAAPGTQHQPVPCMMCEDAPCEIVCPVGATLHDSEGLNLQVYNRCVGTRFCSNNCPYKVRRFNFLQYSDVLTETYKGQRNPDVSVRNRGVMEKCTYCIQRIERAHIDADKDSRRIADGEVVTACQAVCPTQAIVFGDMGDPDSAVSRAKSSPREYLMLEELNTRPHTSYAARVRNPNPALPGDAA